MKIFNYIGDLLSGSPETYTQPTFNLIEDTDLVNETVITVNANQTVVTTIPCNKYRGAFIEGLEPGSEITPTGTIDPDNISTTEAQLINGNLTDLTYNNSSAGTVNKSLPAIDLGSVQAVGQLALWWWTNATYMASNYKIQTSIDGTTWTDVYTNLDSTGLQGQRVDFAMSSSFRYARVFCVQGNNASWVVISELKAFSQGQTIKKELDNTVDTVVVCNASSVIEIQNNSSQSKTYTINHII